MMEQKRRKDQWTLADDEKLAEIVIQTVQNGRTQLEAFEQASQQLNRTKQACGFRWNKTLRTQYGQVLNSVRKRPKQLMLSHLKLALSSFEELSEAYNELEIKYSELQSEYEKVVKWIQQGVVLVKEKTK